MISKILGNKNLLVLVAGILLYAGALQIHRGFERPVITVSKQDSSLNFNQNFLRIFSLGNKKLLSDLIWVQTLLEADLELYSRKDLGNWMYLRFMTIAELDPMFYENYFYGGLYLSIVKDDLQGAANVYSRGLKIYPDDYQLNYNAGFNYYFEMGDYEKGLPLLEKVKNHPKAPISLLSIVNKLKMETGVSAEIVFELVQEQYKKTLEPKLKEKLKTELYSIRAEIDLGCLNSKSPAPKQCRKEDLFGAPYSFINGKYVTEQPVRPYRLKRKNIKI